MTTSERAMIATMTLSEFLFARIAEDEAVATECPIGAQSYVTSARATLLPPDAKVTAWTRERALAECEAKRRIVALHDNRYDLGDCVSCADGWQDLTTGDSDHAPLPYPCPTLRQLATVYADHPDYDETWRP